MTTATLLPGTIQAKEGEVGQEYRWINAKGEIGARTLLAGLKDGKAVVKFWVDGYGFDTQAHTVAGSQMLAPSTEGGKLNKSKEAPKAKQARIQPPVQAKSAVSNAAKVAPKAAVEKEASTRIPKKLPGEKTARVELVGFSFRKDYRARLSPTRARFCQAAVKDSCHCRCAGSLHGKDHKPWFEAEEALFQKSPNGAITALQVLNLVKKFGGVVIHEKKPRKVKTQAKVAAKPAVKAQTKAQVKPQNKSSVKVQAKAKTKAVVKTKLPS